jgi:MFS family permease
MELGGVSVYLSEIATPGHKGFYVAWQSGSQQVSVMFAAAVGVFLNSVMPPAKIQAWGWRVPLLLGCVIIPFLFRLRSSLQETDQFKARKVHPSLQQILHSLVANWSLVIIGMLMVTMTTVSFYFITAYTPTFGSAILKLPPIFNLTVALCVGAANLFWLPVSGAISDRIGRKPLLIGCTTLMLLTSYVSLAWLSAAPSFGRLLAVQLWFSLLYGCYNGALVVFLTEVMPTEVRTTGFSLAYSLATALFGGFTPAVSTYLIHLTHNRAIPSVWLCFAAASGLVATLLAKPYVEQAPQVTAAAESSVVKV